MEQVEQMDKGVAEHRREMKQYSSNDTVIQMIVLALLCIVSLQPLVGLFTNLNVPTQQECLAKINAMFLRKSEWIRYLGYLSLVVAILAALVKSNISLKDFFLSLIQRKPWNVCFLLLFLYVSFSTFAIAPLLQQALNGEEYRYEGFFSIIAYAGFFSLASLLTNEKYKRFWMTFTVSVAVVLGGCALYSYHSVNPILLTYMNRQVRSEGGYIAATFIQYNHYAYYLCMMVVMAAGLFLTEKNRLFRVVYLVFFGFLEYILAYNGTRGGYLAAIIGVITITLFMVLRKGAKWGSIVLVWGVFLIASLAASGVFLQRFSSIFADLGGVIENGDQEIGYGTGRWVLWKRSIQLIKYKPLIGYGTNMAFYAMAEIGQLADLPHNEYLQHMLDFGLVGISLYLGGLISLFASCLKKIKKLPAVNVILGCVVIAYAVSAFFGVTVVEVLPFFYISLGLVKWSGSDSIAAE
ncbi:MAG: O-antigen ligase family protein [Acetatifactor sp.]